MCLIFYSEEAIVYMYTFTCTETSSASYFAVNLNFTGCYTTFHCEPILRFIETKGCSLQYTTNSTYGTPSDTIRAQFNKVAQFYHLIENTQPYFFEFLIVVNEIISVKKRINVTLQSSKKQLCCTL